MSVNLSKVVIIIPSFNEGKRIVKVIKAIREKGFQNIVVVDDGSTDNSMELIKDFNVTILSHLVNRGAGAATETGLSYCRDVIDADTVVMIDADTQHDADDIGKLMEAHYRENADITIGNRFLENQKQIPFKNRCYNLIANIITSVLVQKKISDSQSGFKIFNRIALKKIIIDHDRYEHCSEILIKGHEHNLKIIDVPIRVYYTLEIKDKGQHFTNGIRTLINLMYSVLFKK